MYFLGENAGEFLGIHRYVSLPGAFLVDFMWAFYVDFVNIFFFVCVVLGVFGYFSSLRGVLGANMSVHQVKLLDEI